MPVIGAAEVLIRPTFPGFQKEVRKAVEGVGAPAGQSAGSRLGASLRKWGVRGAVAAGGAIVAGLGYTLKKGFDRLSAIENAEAKLRGLGHSAADVQGIMDNALKAVQGTAFGLDEAATVAASAVAAGVKPGEDLERTLGLVGDAATIAGIGMDEMGSIFNKVATGNKVTMQEVNQLGDAGIPIMQMLADEMGVTAGEVRDMVTKGEVDFDTFRNAIESNVGGAALSAGDTTAGAFANLKASISRVGANLLSSIFPKFKEGFTGITEWLAPIEEKAKAVGEAIGTFLGRAADFITTTVVPSIKSLWQWLQANLIPVLQNVAAWVGEHIIPALADFAKGVGGTILSSVQSLWEKLTNLGDWFKSNEGQIKGVADTVGNVLGGAIRGAGDAAAWIIDKLGKLAGWLIDNKVLVLGAAAAYGTWKAVMLGIRFGRWVAGLAKTALAWGRETAAVIANTAAKLKSKAETIALAAMYAGQWIKQQAMSIAGWVRETAVMVAHKAAQLASAAATKAVAIAQKALNLVMRANPIGLVVTALLALGAGLVAAYKKSETFRNIVDGAWSAIKSVVGAVWKFLRDKVFKPLVQWFKDLGTRAGSFKDVMVGAWNTVKDALGRAWDWIYKNVIMAFASRIKWLQVQFQLKVMQIRRIWEGIKAVFRAVYNWVKQRVFDAFRTAANNLRNNFSNVVQRIKDIWSGIKSAFRAVKDWVVRNVINKFKDSFDSLLSKVRTIRDRIGDAWRGIANKFRRPINWVINRVWNDGIAKAFNSAASAIGISTRLPDEAAIPRFAKGGYHKGGWALVGEEGPELVNFAQPGQVYTAKQTREIMNSGPVGDLKDDLASALGSAAGSLAGVTVGGAVEGLKAAAAAVLNPLKTLISNTVGQWGRFGRLGGGVGTRAIDEVLKWVGKKEEAELAKATGSLHGGTAPGSGAWRRPSRGPITSGYGPRWGSFHAGIDVAGGGPTYAAADGTVYRVGSGILGGRTGIGIGISHGSGVFTYYGHNPVGGPRVRPGQRVAAGQHIGYQGATGNVTGTHLHFELHRGGWGRHVNPRALGVFDKGGMLAPGAMAINLGSKPEPVLTPGQWDTLKAAATNAPGLSAKEQYRALYEGARDGVASGFSGGTRTTRTYARQGGF